MTKKQLEKELTLSRSRCTKALKLLNEYEGLYSENMKRISKCLILGDRKAPNFTEHTIFTIDQMCDRISLLRGKELREDEILSKISEVIRKELNK